MKPWQRIAILLAVLAAGIYFSWSQVRQARADVVLPTPTAVATRTAPILKTVYVWIDFESGRQGVVYKIVAKDGSVVQPKTEQVAPISATPQAYVTAARLAFERALSGSTPIPGITPVSAKGTITP